MSHACSPATVQPGDLTLDQVRSRMAKHQAVIDELKRRYPTRRAVLLQVLHLAQAEFGWVPRVAIEWSAEVSECAPAHAFSVVEFYTMYRQVPKGKHLVQICQTMCCTIQGAEDLIAATEKSLGIHVGDTTEDGLFSLVRVECLALCGSGPGVMIDDQAIGPVPHALGSGNLPEGHLDVAEFHPSLKDLEAWFAFLRAEHRVHPTATTFGGHPITPVADALGRPVLNTKGHPLGVAAGAKPLPAGYSPAAPALKVAAKVEGEKITVTWANDPGAAKLVVERSDDGGTTWRDLATVTARDQKAADTLPVGQTAHYRVIAHEKDRVAKPSAIVSATGAVAPAPAPVPAPAASPAPAAPGKA